MKTPPTTPSHFKLWICLIFLFVVSSCDFSTHEYYKYTNNKDTDHEIYFMWSDSSQCGMTIKDSNFQYDSLQLFFPSNQSTVVSRCEHYYRNVYDSLGTTIDSIELCANYFNIAEDDPRIPNNDFVILKLYNGKTLRIADTLFRKKVENTFIDRLPLPKLH